MSALSLSLGKVNEPEETPATWTELPNDPIQHYRIDLESSQVVHPKSQQLLKGVPIRTDTPEGRRVVTNGHKFTYFNACYLVTRSIDPANTTQNVTGGQDISFIHLTAPVPAAFVSPSSSPSSSPIHSSGPSLANGESTRMLIAVQSRPDSKYVAFVMDPSTHLPRIVIQSLNPILDCCSAWYQETSLTQATTDAQQPRVEPPETTQVADADLVREMLRDTEDDNKIASKKIHLLLAFKTESGLLMVDTRAVLDGASILGAQKQSTTAAPAPKVLRPTDQVPLGTLVQPGTPRHVSGVLGQPVALLPIPAGVAVTLVQNDTKPLLLGAAVSGSVKTSEVRTWTLPVHRLCSMTHDAFLLEFTSKLTTDIPPTVRVDILSSPAVNDSLLVSVRWDTSTASLFSLHRSQTHELPSAGSSHTIVRTLVLGCGGTSEVSIGMPVIDPGLNYVAYPVSSPDGDHNCVLIIHIDTTHMRATHVAQASFPSRVVSIATLPTLLRRVPMDVVGTGNAYGIEEIEDGFVRFLVLDERKTIQSISMEISSLWCCRYPLMPASEPTHAQKPPERDSVSYTVSGSSSLQKSREDTMSDGSEPQTDQTLDVKARVEPAESVPAIVRDQERKAELVNTKSEDLAPHAETKPIETQATTSTASAPEQPPQKSGDENVVKDHKAAESESKLSDRGETSAVVASSITPPAKAEKEKEKEKDKEKEKSKPKTAASTSATPASTAPTATVSNKPKLLLRSGDASKMIDLDQAPPTAPSAAASTSASASAATTSTPASESKPTKQAKKAAATTTTGSTTTSTQTVSTSSGPSTPSQPPTPATPELATAPTTSTALASSSQQQQQQQQRQSQAATIDELKQCLAQTTKRQEEKLDQLQARISQSVKDAVASQIKTAFEKTRTTVGAGKAEGTVWTAAEGTPKPNATGPIEVSIKPEVVADSVASVITAVLPSAVTASMREVILPAQAKMLTSLFGELNQVVSNATSVAVTRSMESLQQTVVNQLGSLTHPTGVPQVSPTSSTLTGLSPQAQYNMNMLLQQQIDDLRRELFMMSEQMNAMRRELAETKQQLVQYTSQGSR